MILFSFYPTSPATTVQEIAQWRNLYLVIIYKVSSLKLCIFNFSALSVSYISSMAVRRKCTCFQQVIFLWIFQCKWKFRSCEALFIEVPLTQAQVSPGAAQNSLRSLSAQAILMGIPFPHALGCPTKVGCSAANAPFRKPTGVLLSSGDVMHHSRISSWAFYLQYHDFLF